MARLPIYMKAIDHRTIKVKWWYVMYLRMKYYYLSIVRRLLRKEYCKICGQELTEIRGKYPKQPRRRVCACCATERLEGIEEQNNVEAKRELIKIIRRITEIYKSNSPS